VRRDSRTSQAARIFAATAGAMLILTSCAWFRPERVEHVAVVSETVSPGTAPGPAVAGSPGAVVAGKRSGGRTVFVPGAKSKKGPKPNYASDAGVTPNEIVLGTIQPMDGPARQLGEPLYRSTQAYVNDLNARGGINGRRVRLELQTACINCEAENLLAAKALVQQKHVFAVVNTYMNTYAFNAALNYLNQQKVPLIQGWAGSGESSWKASQTPWNVYFTVRNEDAVRIYADWLDTVMKQWQKAGRLPNPDHPHWVATVSLDVSQDRTRSQAFRRQWEKRGSDYKVVDQEYVAAEEETVTRMDSFVAAMRQSGANGVFSASNITLVFGMQAASRQNWKVPWVAKSAWGRAATDNCGTPCTGGFTDNNGWGWPKILTPQMRQYMQAMRRYYPPGAQYADAQTLGGWIGMQGFEFAASQLGADLTRRSMMPILTNLRAFDTGIGALISTSSADHLGMGQSMMLQICKNQFFRSTDWLTPGSPMKRVTEPGNTCGWGY
jgi:ABC-type branched-subunit amino acid transport system substrate-binding protein